jgi:hypothetical protein
VAAIFRSGTFDMLVPPILRPRSPTQFIPAEQATIPGGANMGDDKSNRGSPDRDRIDINDPNEVRHWTKALGVTPDQLKDAVKAAGTQAARVQEFLGKTVARP